MSLKSIQTELKNLAEAQTDVDVVKKIYSLLFEVAALEGKVVDVEKPKRISKPRNKKA